MTLRQIQYAVEVDRLGSLSNAAKSLFISQSTLSFAIKDLERELGMTLFERSRSGMRTTEGGLLFLKKARDALNAFAELENISASPRDEVAVLRVAAVQSGLFPLVFQRLTDELERLGTRFRLQCKMCETGEVVDRIASGECELGFVYATDRQEQTWRQDFSLIGLEAQRVCSLEICAILSEDDPLAARSNIALSELAGYTFIFSGDDGLTGFSNLADYSAQNFSLTAHPRYVDAQDSLLLNALLRKPGRFSIGHRSTLPLYSGGLAYVPLRDRQLAHFLMLRVKGRPMSLYAERLSELIGKAAADLPIQ